MRLKSYLATTIGLLAMAGVGAPAAVAITPDDPGGAVQFSINSAADVRAISPWIYGTNFNSVPGATLNRIGGNRLTGYNWENNASNAGADWYHHSDFGMAGGANDPPGAAFRGPIQIAAGADQAVVVTVPMAGYVAADGAGTVDETEIAPSPRFKEVVPLKSTIYPGATLSTTPDKNDGYVFTDELAHWVENVKTPQQPVFYSLDNEPGLWGEALPAGWQSGSQPRPWENPPVPGVAPSAGGRTHPTIHPFAPTFAELRDKTIAHAGAIKDVNPDALVFGGVGYGWNDFVTLQGAPDAVTNPSHLGGDQQSGELHYYEWLLQQVRNEEIAQGRKLMDVLDLHWYTEVYADGQRITNNIATPAAVEARVQAPRSLWDPTYVEDSWISQWGTWAGSPGNQGPVQLLPRVQRDIDDFNPGTKIAITEYDYGGGDHISGAIAQADALGIFGREGVFAASLWGEGTYQNAAFAMFLDYDGAGGAFGDTSIAANTSDIAQSAVYASMDASDPDRMVLVAINRTGAAITTGIAVTHDRLFDHAEAYLLTSAVRSPQRVADIEIELVNAFQYTMPAYSVTTLVLSAAGQPGDFNGDGTVDGQDFLQWQRDPGAGALSDWTDNFGASAATTTAAVVPEPVTWTLCISALCALATAQRRRRR